MECLKPRPDRRCVKTKKAIKNALASLMIEKDITQITIKDIADVADINRKTFYSHYVSIFDILDEIENEIVTSLNSIVKNMDFSKGRYDTYSVFEKLTGLIYEDFDFYKYLLQSKTYSNLANKIKTVLKETITNILLTDMKVNKNTLSMAVEFIAAGTISVYQQWLGSDRSQSLEDVSRTIGVLTFNGFNNIVDAKT